jgi:hypothetical protein
MRLLQKNVEASTPPTVRKLPDNKPEILSVSAGKFRQKLSF